jgi:23S rRNA-/tRNA-specific pseudouridylate synthase
LFAKPADRAAVKKPPTNAEAPLRDEPRVIYEDDDLAVVLKPPGWSCLPHPKVVDPTWARQSGLARRVIVGDLMCDTTAPPLQGWLLLRFGADPHCDAARDQASDRGLAHRLDVDVSGPILVGKTLRGFEHAKKQIVLGVLKDYVVLVHGTFSTERGECCVPVDTSKFDQYKRVHVGTGGQPATTVWEVVAEYECPETEDTFSLVHCRMVTLRTHQIRAHMQHLGNPIVGDSVYGVGQPPEWCPRIFIHKLRIGFFDLNGKACFEQASLQTAPDLWSALAGLRKAGGMAAKGCGAPGL